MGGGPPEWKWPPWLGCVSSICSICPPPQPYLSHKAPPSLWVRSRHGCDAFFREMFPLRTNWWYNCHLHWAPPVQMAFFYSRTLCFRTPLKHYECSHSCRKGCGSPGHNGNCLIVARVLNYEVRFQNAAQIALWGKAVTRSLRRSKTLRTVKAKRCILIEDLFWQPEKIYL